MRRAGKAKSYGETAGLIKVVVDAETDRLRGAAVLANDGAELCDATYLLGFSNQSNFFRVCKRWFGTSPRHYRIRLIGARRVDS